MDEGEAAQQTGGDESAAQPGDKWGDPISEERQAELRTLFKIQETWAEQPEEMRGNSVLMYTRLTGADLFWWATTQGSTEFGFANHLHLEGAALLKANMEGAYLSGAQLQKADLTSARLEGADLTFARLNEAYLYRTCLERANLYGAHLEGADLLQAQLKEANLTGVSFDKTSRLNDSVLTGASLDQVTYDGVNLTVVDWSLVPVLGDELTARQRKGKDGKPKDRKERLRDFTAAVRANRVLAVTLRSQGMNEDADRYAYCAQLLQRTVLRLRRRWGSAFGSWLLDLVSGYGYKPMRSVIAYVAIILFFAGLYLLNSQFAAPHLRWDEALVLSVSAFHGRGFFTTGISLGDTLARLAAGEAIIGLLIEITFIATFTQRFFAR